jgi:heavy metal sensor kinase
MTWRWHEAAIRTRLTAWYAASIFVMLTLYAGATYAAVRHEFLEQLDEQLADDLSAAEQASIVSPDGGLLPRASEARGSDERDSPLRVVEIWSPDGEAIHRPPGAGALPSTPVAPRAGPEYASLTGNHQTWRTLTTSTSLAGRPVIVRVSRSEARVREQVHEVLVVLVFGLPLVVGLAGIGGYVLARHALSPMDRLAADAQRITADRLHERLTVPNERDEIGRLAVVVNDAFARLEASFDQLRRFTADASHELRTPLAIIRGLGEAGLAEIRTAAEYKDAIASMLEEVDRLSSLVDTLLRLSHADAGRVPLSREPVDLAGLVREAAGSLAPLAEERRQALEVRTAAQIVVMVDRLILREAITNILDTAIKYSPEQARIEIQVSSRGGEAVVDVADEGPGIPPEYRARIFDRFFRVDRGRSRDHGGSGLGLAIAKWAVEVNGGRIAVAAGQSGGSVFRLTLPLDVIAGVDVA